MSLAHPNLLVFLTVGIQVKNKLTQKTLDHSSESLSHRDQRMAIEISPPLARA